MDWTVNLGGKTAINRARSPTRTISDLAFLACPKYSPAFACDSLDTAENDVPIPPGRGILLKNRITFDGSFYLMKDQAILYDVRSASHTLTKTAV